MIRGIKLTSFIALPDNASELLRRLGVQDVKRLIVRRCTKNHKGRPGDARSLLTQTRQATGVKQIQETDAKQQGVNGTSKRTPLADEGHLNKNRIKKEITLTTRSSANKKHHTHTVMRQNTIYQRTRYCRKLNNHETARPTAYRRLHRAYPIQAAGKP
jgi:hypothetical protein